MKKLVWMMAIATIALLWGGIVFADAGLPSVYTYDAVVTKEEGTTIYGEKYVEEEGKYIFYPNGKLEKDAVVTISYIEERNHTQYARIWDENLLTNDGSSYGIVLFEDLKKKTPWNMEDFHFYNYEYDGTALHEEGIKIYEWPSKVENVIGIIPNKAEIKYQVSWEDDYWGYLTYNGITGWVYLQGIGVLNTSEKIAAGIKGATIRDSENHVVGKIPSGTILTNIYRMRDGYETIKYYISYQGIDGFVSTNDVAYAGTDKSYRYTVNYEGAVLVGLEGEIIAIPKGAILEYSFEQYGYVMNDGTELYEVDQILTNYNGIEGWVFRFASYYGDDETYNEYGKIVLENIMKSIEDVKTFYQEQKNTSGERGETEVETKPDMVIVEDFKEEPIVVEQSTPTTTTSSREFSSMDLIIVCLLGALAIATVALILIILLNQEANKKSLIFLIPLLIVLIAVLAVMTGSYDQMKAKILGKEETEVVEEATEVKQPEPPSEKPMEIIALRTSYTKNFFDLSQYGGVTYKSEGKQFGYPEAYRDSKDDWKYGTEIALPDAVYASSTLAPQGQFSYEAEHITNGNRSNTWIEGAEGFGIGEYVEITQTNHTSSNRKYKEICIVNGYAETQKKWENNSRVKKLNLYHNDKKVATITLLDTITPQYIDISSLNIESKANSNEKFKFEIVEVYEEEYPGERYSDTAITGIMFGY